MKPEQKHLVNVFEMHQTCVLHDKQSPSPPWDYLPEVLFIFNSALVVSGHETTVISGHFTCGAGFLWPIFPRPEWAPSPQPESWIKGGLFIHRNTTENNIREICGSVCLQRLFEKLSGWENNTLEMIDYNHWTVETIETILKR